MINKLISSTQHSTQLPMRSFRPGDYFTFESVLHTCGTQSNWWPKCLVHMDPELKLCMFPIDDSE